MNLTFFAFDSRFFWEDVYNYNDWIIQLNVRTLKYRLVDPFGVRRESGTFEQCKETLLKYIYACELTEQKENTIVILHGFGQKKSSVKTLANSLKDINANIVSVSYATLRRGIGFHSNILAQMLQNSEAKGKFFIVNVGSSCLITRKMLSESTNFRLFNIERILDINPMNSGSDLVDLLFKNRFLNFLLGPMFKDIATKNAVTIEKLPPEIDHGIIFASGFLTNFIKKRFSKYESFPRTNPPDERSYAEKIVNVKGKTLYSINDETVAEYCKNFITTGDFMQSWQTSKREKKQTKKKTG